MVLFKKKLQLQGLFTRTPISCDRLIVSNRENYAEGKMINNVEFIKLEVVMSRVVT